MGSADFIPYFDFVKDFASNASNLLKALDFFSGSLDSLQGLGK